MLCSEGFPDTATSTLRVLFPAQRLLYIFSGCPENAEGRCSIQLSYGTKISTKNTPCFQSAAKVNVFSNPVNSSDGHFGFRLRSKKDQACAGETQAQIESDFRLQEKLASERDMITASTLSFTAQKSTASIN